MTERDEAVEHGAGGSGAWDALGQPHVEELLEHERDDERR